MDAKDESEYDDLFRAEYPAVWRAVLLIVFDRDIADEVCQDAFAAVFAHWEKVSTYERPGAWVRRVAIRRAVRVAGRDRRRQATELAGQARAGRPEGASRWDETSDLIVEALAALPPHQRAAIALHYLLDLPVRDVATAIGCREATANVHLHRGRRHLAEMLRPVLREETDDGTR